jgi:DNA-binding response OmpR family regulator
VCYRLRSSPKHLTTPVIMISAKAKEEDRAMASRVGANAYLKKPIGLEQLLGTVNKFLEREKQT